MIQPSISLKGRAAEALEFYEKILKGTDKKIFRYCDMPIPQNSYPAHMKNWIGYSTITFYGTVFSICDMDESTENGNLISIMINLATVDEVKDIYNKLMDGGEAVMELAPQFYAKMYAWVKDKFGIGWQLICE